MYNWWVISAARASNEVSWLRIILDLIIHLKVLISGSCTVFLKFESEMIQERYMIVAAMSSLTQAIREDLEFDRAAQVRLVGDPNLDRLPLDPPPPPHHHYTPRPLQKSLISYHVGTWCQLLKDTSLFTIDVNISILLWLACLIVVFIV